MDKYASKVVEQAKSWLGLKESDGSFKVIIDTYNSHSPLARGVKMRYDWEWCAAFVSAVAIQLGYTDIIPTECSCTKMIALLQQLDAWEERDDRIPDPGDIMFYNWEAPAGGDDTSDADHAGIVEKVSEGNITVIEGNYDRSVKRRVIPVDHRYIRGYGVPKYDEERAASTEDYTLEMGYLKKGSRGEAVRALQILLIGRGYNCGSTGADGDFGSATDAAVRKYQQAKDLTVDGIVGKATMGSLLGVQ